MSSLFKSCDSQRFSVVFQRHSDWQFLSGSDLTVCETETTGASEISLDARGDMDAWKKGWVLPWMTGISINVQIQL